MCIYITSLRNFYSCGEQSIYEGIAGASNSHSSPFVLMVIWRFFYVKKVSSDLEHLLSTQSPLR